MVTGSMEVCEMDDVPECVDDAATNEHRSPSVRVWTADELDELDNAPLIRVAVARPDGTVSRFVVFGHVNVGGDEIVRSLNGTSGVWYRAATSTGQGEIDVGGRRVKVCQRLRRQRPPHHYRAARDRHEPSPDRPRPGMRRTSVRGAFIWPM